MSTGYKFKTYNDTPNLPNFYSGFKINSINTTHNVRPSSAGANRKSTNSNSNNIYATNVTNVDSGKEPIKSDSHHNNRPSSAGINRANSSSGSHDNYQKKTIWTPYGIQTHYSSNDKRADSSYQQYQPQQYQQQQQQYQQQYYMQQTQQQQQQPQQQQPGYARPKSAGIGRSKSQGITGKITANDSNSEQNPYKIYATAQPKDRPITPVLNRPQHQQPTTQSTGSSTGYKPYTGSESSTNNNHWSTSYRLHYGLSASVNANGVVEPEKHRVAMTPQGSTDETSKKSVPVVSSTAVENRPNSASSRIRQAISLGNHYAAELQQQPDQDKNAAVKVTPKPQVVSQQPNYQTHIPPYQQHQPIVSTSTQQHTNIPLQSYNDVNKQTTDSKLDDATKELNRMSTIGADVDFGLGTDDAIGAFPFEREGMDGRQMYDSHSRTHPEVSTASASLELAEGSNNFGHDLRHGSSIEDVSQDLPRLPTLPNQFCTLKEASELKKLLYFSQGMNRLNPSAAPVGPAATALMDMYMVGKIVGVGSYGKVRAAWHRLTGSKVAIKTYDKAKLKDPEHWKRVQSEIKIMEQVSHPRIVRMYESVETPKRVHLIIECLEGGNLCSYVKSKRSLSESESKRIFFQLLQAMEFLHSQCVIHRDIKLENVLFDNNADIKLIDFGFSTISPDGKKLKVFCGTPSYMAPEIVRRTEYEGKPVDMWGLGILLYALLCGCFPFRAKSYPDLYRRIARGTYTIPDELSSQVKDLIRQLLTVDATQRITAKQAMQHPWLESQLLTATDMTKLRTQTPILISDRPVDDINDKVVADLEKFGVDKDDIVRQVMSKNHCSLSTLYYLLLDTHIRSGQGSKNRLSYSKASNHQQLHSNPATNSHQHQPQVTVPISLDANSSSNGYAVLKQVDTSGGIQRPRSASANRGPAVQQNRPRSASATRRANPY